MGIHRFIIEGTEYEVQVGQRSGREVRVNVNGKAYDIEIEDVEAAGTSAAAAPRASAPAKPKAAASATPSRGGPIQAPISGVVLRIDVQPGQRVVRGTTLLILEAMKMENEIFAAADGVVQSVEVKPQQEVREGDVLLVIAAG